MKVLVVEDANGKHWEHMKGDAKVKDGALLIYEDEYGPLMRAFGPGWVAFWVEERPE